MKKTILASTLIITSILTNGCKQVDVDDVRTMAAKLEANVQRESVDLDIHKDYKKSELNQEYIKNGKLMWVKATAYAQDPITCTGNPCVEGYTIAVDKKIIPLGTRVYIPKFNRVFVCDDVGGMIKGNRIDIYMDDVNKALEWGIQDLQVYILKD